MSETFINKKIPSLVFLDTDGNKVSSKVWQGFWVLLYFYPKNFTSGCTTQACDLRDFFAEFKKRKIQIYGVSPDSGDSHLKFIKKLDLPYHLLVDPDHRNAERLNVWKEKSMYGKKYWGIVRTSFLIGPDQKVKWIDNKVKVKDHAKNVLNHFDVLVSQL